MRTKTLISFPKYNRCKGDLSKRWYVEFAYRLPNDDTPHRYRVYSGLCTGTADERDSIAKKLVDFYTQYLKSGEYINQEPNLNPLKENETHRPETKAWIEARESYKINALYPRFLNSIKHTLRKKTLQDYTTKIKTFVDYYNEHIGDVTIQLVERNKIVPFFEYLANEKHLCRCTIEKYMQVIRQFYNWCEDVGVRKLDTNPISRIPKFGRVIDCSPGVFDVDERKRLKMAMVNKEPFLWLACEMLYYCAIRPGTEMRLLKIGDIDFKTATITIKAEIAKNKTTERVGMPKILYDHMIDLNIDKYDKELYLFGRCGYPSDEPMGKNTMRNRFNHYRELLGISKDKKFYSWKHSGAISAAQNGASIFEIKDQLRHKSIATTEEYLRKREPKVGVAAERMDKI